MNAAEILALSIVKVKVKVFTSRPSVVQTAGQPVAYVLQIT